MIDRYIELFESVITTPFNRVSGPFVPPDELKANLYLRQKVRYHLRTPFRLAKRAIKSRSGKTS